MQMMHDYVYAYLLRNELPSCGRYLTSSRRYGKAFTKYEKQSSLEKKANRCKGPDLGHSCPNTRKKKIMVMGKAEGGNRERGGSLM